MHGHQIPRSPLALAVGVVTYRGVPFVGINEDEIQPHVDNNEVKIEHGNSSEIIKEIKSSTSKIKEITEKYKGKQ